MCVGQMSKIEYKKLKKRLRKSFYYGDDGSVDDRLSLPLSELMVSYFEKNAPFDQLDLDFASQLSKEACIGPYTLIVALLYLERLRMLDEEHFDTSDPADLYLNALVLANKYLFDSGESDFAYNDEWAASAGKSLEDVNAGERKFLNSLRWDLMVRRSEFNSMLLQMEASLALRQSTARGWMTYTDLRALSDMLSTWNSAMALLATTVGLLTIAYTAVMVSALSPVTVTSGLLFAPQIFARNLRPGLSVSHLSHATSCSQAAACPDVQNVNLLVPPTFPLRNRSALLENEAGMANVRSQWACLGNGSDSILVRPFHAMHFKWM